MYKAAVSKSQYDAMSDDDKKHYRLDEDADVYLFQLEAVTMGDSVYAVEDVGSLKQTVSELRIAERNLKKFEGLDPSKARKALKDVEKFAKLDPEGEAAQRFETMKGQLEDKHAGEIGEKEEKIKELEEMLHDSVITTAATRAIMDAKASVALLLPTIERDLTTEVVEMGGKKRMVARVLDKKNGGVRITLKSGSRDPMEVKEYVETFRTVPEYRGAFEGDRKQGIGQDSTETTSQSGGGKVSITDQAALEANFDDIASGKVEVVD